MLVLKLKCYSNENFVLPVSGSSEIETNRLIIL